MFFFKYIRLALPRLFAVTSIIAAASYSQFGRRLSEILERLFRFRSVPSSVKLTRVSCLSREIRNAFS